MKAFDGNLDFGLEVYIGIGLSCMQSVYYRIRALKFLIKSANKSSAMLIFGFEDHVNMNTAMKWIAK